MRRTLAVLGVAATLAIGQAAVAGPASAKTNCEGFPIRECQGGRGSGGGGGGGGGGGQTEFDVVNDQGSTISGGRGFGGGGTGGGGGRHCFSPTDCVGGSSNTPAS